MSVCIAIVGAESTGKTTLAQALAQRVRERAGARSIAVPEALRDWCAQAGRTPRADEQAAIAQAQARHIEQALAAHAVVVADTTPLMTAIYSDLLFDDHTLYEPALRWHARHCNATLLTGLDLPWQADGLQRDGPHVRLPVDERVRAALARAGIAHAVIYGSGQARLDAAWRALHPLLGSGAHNEGTAAPARLRPRCRECLDPECERAGLLPHLPG